MPFNIKLEQIIVGYTEHDVYEGEEATLIVRSFTSSENKEWFKKLVYEGLPSDLIKRIPNGNFEKGTLVNEMVAILKKDLSATVYLDVKANDLKKIVESRSRQVVADDTEISLENTIDVKRLGFENIFFPPDAGVIVLFRIGDRKGFFFDVSPLESNKPREFEVEKLLGNYASYLLQPELFEIEEDDWKHLFENQWFPFIFLSNGLRSKMVDFAKRKKVLDDLLPEINHEVVNNVSYIRDRLNNHSLFM